MKIQATPELLDAKIKGGDDISGLYLLKRGNAQLRVVASNGVGWDHVSVSLPTRCPTWEEMCWVKDKFFEPEEVVMQLHPARSQYVNNMPYCLHLWRPQNAEYIAAVIADWGDEWPYGEVESPGVIPTPPAHLVGILPKAGAAK